MLVLSLATLLPAAAQLPDIVWIQPYSLGTSSVASSADGRVVAEACDGNIKVWDAGEGKLLRIPSPGSFFSVALSPDGRSIAATNYQSRIFLWDITTGQQRFSMVAGQPGCPSPITFSPDGTTIAMNGCDSVRLLDALTGRVVRSLYGHDRSQGQLRFSSDGHFLFTAGINGINCWETGNGRLVDTLRYRLPASGIALSSDNRYLVTATYRGMLWDLATGDTVGSFALPGAAERMEFIPDRREMVFASGDNRAIVWNPFTRQTIREFPAGEDVRSIAVMSDGRRMIIGDRRTGTTIWDLTNGERIRGLGSHPHWIPPRFSPDGRFLVTGIWPPSDTPKTGVYDVASGSLLYITKRARQVMGDVQFSPDSRYMAVAEQEWYTVQTSVTIYDLATGDSIRTFPATNASLGPSFAWSPDGNVLATPAGPITILRDPATGGNVRVLRTGLGTTGVQVAEFTPDGSRLVLIGDDSLQVWETASSTRLGGFHIATGNGTIPGPFMSISPDGRMVVVGTGDSTLQLWDLATMSSIGQTIRDTQAITQGMFNHDGRFFVTGDGNGELKTWDVATWQIVRKNSAYAGSNRSFAISPNSRYIATTPRDGSLILWEHQGIASDVPLSASLHRFRASIAPMPAGEQATLLVESATPLHSIRILLIDALGRVRSSLDRDFTGGSQAIPIDLAPLEPGLYFCRVVSGANWDAVPLLISR